MRCFMSAIFRRTRCRIDARINTGKSMIRRSPTFDTQRTMPNIMICCPTLGTSVPTGLTTEKIKFESLSGVMIPLRCPDCMKLHKWERKDAWVEKEA
jgi:hypothetical protein